MPTTNPVCTTETPLPAWGCDLRPRQPRLIAFDQLTGTLSTATLDQDCVTQNGASVIRVRGSQFGP